MCSTQEEFDEAYYEFLDELDEIKQQSRKGNWQPRTEIADVYSSFIAWTAGFVGKTILGPHLIKHTKENGMSDTPLLMQPPSVILSFIIESSQKEFDKEYDIYMKEYKLVMDYVSMNESPKKEAMRIDFENHKIILDTMARQNGKVVSDASS